MTNAITGAPLTIQNAREVNQELLKNELTAA